MTYICDTFFLRKKILIWKNSIGKKVLDARKTRKIRLLGFPEVTKTQHNKNNEYPP